jgi:predicted transcriptional regulator
MITKDFIKDFIPPLKVTDSGVRALQWMQSFHLDHLPVVEGVKYKGIVKEKDIQKVANKELSLFELNIPLNPIFIHDNQYVFDALEFITTSGFNIVPVINKDGDYVGLLTLVDVIDCFAQTKSVKTPGGIIILHVNEKEYSLSDIARVVESNNAMVLSSSLNQTDLKNIFELTLKVDKLELSRILSSFYRLNYNVVASYHHNDISHDLEDRYNAFMTYLNV